VTVYPNHLPEAHRDWQNWANSIDIPGTMIDGAKHFLYNREYFMIVDNYQYTEIASTWRNW